jgi:hypothetical protein
LALTASRHGSKHITGFRGRISSIGTLTPSGCWFGNGTRKLDLIAAYGQALKASMPWSDGKEVVVAVTEGMGNVTATSKIRGKTFNDTWKENGKIIEKVHAVVSSDGRTLAITVDGTDRQNRSYHNHLIFEKR